MEQWTPVVAVIMFFSSFATVLLCVCLLIQSSIFIFPGALHNLQYCWVWLVRMGVVCGLKGYLELGPFTENYGKELWPQWLRCKMGKGVACSGNFIPPLNCK